MTITGTSGPDNFWLRRETGGGADLLQLWTGVTISLVGSTINVSGGTLLDSRPFASVTGTYTINAGDGNDQLVIDYTTPGVELKNVTFHGGNQADTLYVKGGSLGKIVYNYVNATDGTIQNFTNPGDVAPLSTITYTGLAPIINTGTPTAIVFNLPADGGRCLPGRRRHAGQ